MSPCSVSLVTLPRFCVQERFYFGDNVLPCFESGIPLLKERLRELPDADNVSSAPVSRALDGHAQ